MSTQDWQDRRLRQLRLWNDWIPQESPQRWIWINATLSAASIGVAVDQLVATTTQEFSERPTAQALYLLWNFGTTVVWMMEIVLQIVYYHNHQTSTLLLPLEVWVEGALGVYFLGDSVRLLIRWKLHPTNNKLEGELWDVGISIVAYLGLAIRFWILHQQNCQQDTSTTWNSGCSPPPGEQTRLIEATSS